MGAAWPLLQDSSFPNGRHRPSAVVRKLHALVTSKVLWVSSNTHPVKARIFQLSAWSLALAKHPDRFRAEDRVSCPYHVNVAEASATPCVNHGLAREGVQPACHARLICRSLSALWDRSNGKRQPACSVSPSAGGSVSGSGKIVVAMIFGLSSVVQRVVEKQGQACALCDHTCRQEARPTEDNSISLKSERLAAVHSPGSKVGV